MTGVLAEAGGRLARVEASAVLVDARVYYRAFYRAALGAKRSILLAGWQFDTSVSLLRGDDARRAELPVELVPFLSALCEREPELRVHVLAWDYSIAYAFEREWMQELKFALSTPERVRFEFDRHPNATGSHHQKFAVIDGAVGFAGGMDICDERWDDRDHAPLQPLRRNTSGEPCRPNHEVQAVVTGEAAAVLSEIFRERWLGATGDVLALPAPRPELAVAFARSDLGAHAELPLAASHVGILRTNVASDGSVDREIFRALRAALLGAEHLVYIETQYFTSRSVAQALLERLYDTSKPKLELVIVLPRVADSGKEAFAVGETQRMVLGALGAAARATGHPIRFLCSVADDAERQTGATFIHSKVVVVDDSVLCVGSANMTERSMGYDTELSLFWESDGDAALERDIRRVRASLVAEHAHRSLDEIEAAPSLVAVIDPWLASSSTRLRACQFEPTPPNVVKSMIFDPGGPHTVTVPEALSPDDRERFTRGGGRAVADLVRRSLPPESTDG
jgi:phosphatidylserine/phosphatidylglycerophosphate/cardiolipin synthase-like enzyme